MHYCSALFDCRELYYHHPQLHKNPLASRAIASSFLRISSSSALIPIAGRCQEKVICKDSSQGSVVLLNATNIRPFFQIFKCFSAFADLWLTLVRPVVPKPWLRCRYVYHYILPRLRGIFILSPPSYKKINIFQMPSFHRKNHPER